MPFPVDKQRIAADVVQREAIKKAQSALGILADGFFGPRSLAAVIQLVARVKQYEDLLDVPNQGLAEGPTKNHATHPD